MDTAKQNATEATPLLCDATHHHTQLLLVAPPFAGNQATKVSIIFSRKTTKR